MMFVLVGGGTPRFLRAFPSLSKPAYPGRYKIGFSRGSDGRIARLLCLWEEPAKGHADQ